MKMYLLTKQLTKSYHFKAFPFFIFLYSTWVKFLNPSSLDFLILLSLLKESLGMSACSNLLPTSPVVLGNQQHLEVHLLNSFGPIQTKPIK